MSKINTDNEKAKKDTLQKIETINAVEGFDPKTLTLEIIDMNGGPTRYRLPVMSQLAWFRLKYPDGKVKISVKPGTNCFVGEARVYAHYNDPVDSYLAEGSATRGYLKDKPTVSPREWSQTAALGIALRNAGFGLQFAIAGESYEDNAVNEFDFLSGSETPVAEPGESISEDTASSETSEQISFSDDTQPETPTGASPPEQAQPELNPLEKAMKTMCPIGKYKDKTLGEMIRIDEKTLPYIAKNGGKYGQEIADCAKLICEEAVRQTAV